MVSRRDFLSRLAAISTGMIYGISKGYKENEKVYLDDKNTVQQCIISRKSSDKDEIEDIAEKYLESENSKLVTGALLMNGEIEKVQNVYLTDNCDSLNDYAGLFGYKSTENTVEIELTLQEDYDVAERIWDEAAI